MHTRPLITPSELSTLIGNSKTKVLICDCSFDLSDPAAGQQQYEHSHISGAHYLNLEHDLSGTATGNNGRHPLPDPAVFAARLQELGATSDTLIVAYDRNGSMYAARLWWLLGYVGHQHRAVLDGGLQAWQAAGLPVQDGADAKNEAIPGNFSAKPSLLPTVDRAWVLDNINTRERQVVDARNAERFRGENETMDANAGHIPGAINRFFQLNLQEDGTFKPAEQLRAEFTTLLGDQAPGRVVHQCGSGVTACHNALAMEVAGLRGAALYPGSWSEWSQHDDSPVAVGDQN